METETKDTVEEKDAEGIEITKANELIASFVIAVVLIALIGLVVWAGIKFMPQIGQWIGGWGDDEVACIFDPETSAYDADAVYSFCTEKGFEPMDDSVTDGMDITEEACASVGFIRGDTLQESCDAYCVAKVPDTCTYRPPENIEPTVLNDYLAKTDDLIDDMGKYLGKIEVLIEMYYASGSNNSQRAAILNDKQYKEIVESVHVEAIYIFGDLNDLWPPPPYDGSNPLLDSQARLTSAVAYVMRVDGLIYRFEVNKSSQQWNKINDAIYQIQKNVDYAELGLAMAR